MVTPTTGVVVLIPFPFSELVTSKTLTCGCSGGCGPRRLDSLLGKNPIRKKISRAIMLTDARIDTGS